ncbi:MAG: carboxypeptidase-like regulatory domain-containing protein [Nitrospira sp.]|nr:carboxypeptidase-like regulatory domain-containing protein [Nitrospira sp.]
MLPRMTKVQRAICVCCVVSFNCVFILLVSSAWALVTEFGSVQIFVTDQNDVPIPNVNLCLNMPGQSAQKTTDQNGRFSASLPVGSTTVRTSRNGYANTQTTITMTNGASLVHQIVVQPGQATPLPSFCGGIAGTATGEDNACERITSLEVSGGSKTTSRTVHIVAVFSEKPAFYRLAEFSAAERYPESQFNPDAAFTKKNVAWVPVTAQLTKPVLATSVALTEPHYGTHHLYMQTSLALNGCVSRSRPISVVLEPARLVNYELTGQALERFVAAAKSRRYQFKSGFKFNKKDTTYCLNNAMVLPSDPAQDARVSNIMLEDVSGSFDVFDGPDLMLYWQLIDIEGSFPGLGPLAQGRVRAFASGTAPAVVYDKYSEPSCPYCGPRALKRTLSWRRILYEFRPPPPSPPHSPIPLPVLPGTYNAVRCIAVPDLTRSDQQPSLVKLTLRGPAGDDPINALPPLQPPTLERISPLRNSALGGQ